MEAWVEILPMLSASAKETILAECLKDGRKDGGSPEEAKPSLTKMVEVVHGEMRVFEQNLAALKEIMRSCEAQIKPQRVQKDQTEGANFYDGGTRLLDRTPSDGASATTVNLPPRPAKRPHIVTPDLQLSSGATKKQKNTASTTIPPVARWPPMTMTRAWSDGRATSSRRLPVGRPPDIIYRDGKWSYRNMVYDTIDSVYDAYIWDQRYPSVTL